MNKVVMQIYAVTLFVSFWGAHAWGDSTAASVSGVKAGVSKWHEPIRPLPQPQDEFPQQSALGDRLFHDPRLSANNTVSCASCHNLAREGIDHLPVAVGIGGIRGPIKTPTVYNSSFNFVQFWDGRAASLEEQAAGPVHNPIEMASNWKQVIAKLEQDPEMVRSFAEVYTDGITAKNIVAAIAAFERTLITANSPFDRWLRGDEAALSEKELRGYQLFKSYGCIACHQGANVGGNLYGKMGAMGDYFKDRKSSLSKVDMGRFNVTGKERDRHMFKVPSLRLAARYSYFFHDASADSLEKAIHIMGRYQLGRDIPARDIALIAGFLHTLVGEHPRLKHE
jgi:cytochrome c peroxidase